MMPPGPPPLTKIFVGRLPTDANAQDLRRLFEKYGVVTECDVLNRYGFVHMKTEEMAQTAIRELNNAEFMGGRISVEQSTGKKGGLSSARGRGGFGSRGGMSRGAGNNYSRPSPYDRVMPPREYDRRGPPPPPMDGRGMSRDMGMPPQMSNMRNGYYDGYERNNYEDYYTRRGPPMDNMATRDREMMYRESERRLYDSPRDGFDRRPMPPMPTYERRGDYGDRMSTDMFRRRSPPQANFDREPPPYSSNRDTYGLQPVRRYPPAPTGLDRDMPSARRY